MYMSWVASCSFSVTGRLCCEGVLVPYKCGFSDKIKARTLNCWRLHVQKGHADNQIGCVRVITIDGHQFAEQLEALDDVEHIQCVTFPMTTSIWLQLLHLLTSMTSYRETCFGSLH